MNWISVKDRLPEMIPETCYSEDVLAFCISHGKSTEFHSPNTYAKDEKYISIDRLVKWSDKKEISFRCNRFYGKVTHWMPLPKPPKIEDDDSA